ncbi:MAG TPA: hypothetical protein PLV12_05090, partial [Saprospiraceae bacterium]|nr:hypothetical protein [Saprospiraceae bacterium]
NGKELKEGLDAFIYGERGVYRPGDTMFVSVMLFQHNKKTGPGLDAQFPIKFQAEDSRGKIQFEKNLTENIDHLYHCKVPTSAAIYERIESFFQFFAIDVKITEGIGKMI